MNEVMERQIAAIGELKGKTAISAEFVEWRKNTEEALKALFGEDSTEVEDFNAIYFTPVFLTCRMGDAAFDEAFRNGLEEARVFLLSYI